MLPGLVRLARPQDWIKNVFVLLPLPFALAQKAGGHLVWASFLPGLAGFCLLNSAIYTLNDLFDAKTDRLHPRTRGRPIAMGEVSPPAAIVQMLVLGLLGLALCLTADHRLFQDQSVSTASTLPEAATGQGETGFFPVVSIIALSYLAINIGYSAGAKHIVLLDVFLLSSGFVIRVLLGCALVSAKPSPWLLLCTATLALFLGFTKRRADLTEELDLNHRPSLRGYNKTFLDQAVAICAGVAILAYALYCIEASKTDGVLRTGREMASMPFVAYGILNYLRKVHVEGAGGSPVEVAYHSWTMQLCAIGWIAAVLWSVGRW